MTKSTNHVFEAFIAIVERCRNAFEAGTRAGRGALGYSGDVIVDRLTQRMIEVAILPYTLTAHAGLRRDETFPAADTNIRFREASVRVGDGRVTLSVSQVLRAEMEFLVHWFYCLAAIVKGWFGHRISPPAVLVTDFADEHLFIDGRDDRFVDYCRRGPITPLREARRLFVVSLSKNVSSVPETVTYCRHPLLALLNEAPLGFGRQLGLLVSHLALFVRFHLAILRTPVLALLAKEVAYTRIARALDRNGMIGAIVLTCSVWANQPLWLRGLQRAKVHMIWYSQAPQSATYVSDDVKSDAPQVPWIRVDTHWVWTRSFEQYLRRVGRGEFSVETVGPILWYLPEVTSPATSDAFNVLVFDVPAVNDDVMLMLGEITNNLHPNNLRAFMSDIAALKRDLERETGRAVNVRWKRKRSYTEQYAKEYFDELDVLEASGVFSFAPPHENIYTATAHSDLVIAYPFTSPAYVAERLGVPAVYYDPTSRLVPEFYADTDLVSFASGYADLLLKSVTALLSRPKPSHVQTA